MQFCRNNLGLFQRINVGANTGTLFQATKLPLITWFLAMYLLSQSKNGIAALQLGRQLSVNDNTAWLLKHKLMQAMRERDRA